MNERPAKFQLEQFRALNVAEIYGGQPVRSLANVTLNKVRTKFGVNIETEDGGTSYKVSASPQYTDTSVEAAVDALATFHEMIANSPSLSVNQILNKARIADILRNSGSAARRVAKEPKIFAKASFTKVSKPGTPPSVKPVLSKGMDGFNSIPAATIDRYQRFTLADLHAYLSRQNRDQYLAEFETKLGVRIELNDKGGFNVMLPKRHEGPLDFNLATQIATVLINLETRREKKEAITRQIIRHELNQVVAGRLTPTFAKENSGTTVQKETSRAVVLREATQEVFNVLSESAKKLITEIKLLPISARTENQKTVLNAGKKSDVAIIEAPAGTGKTILAVYTILEMLVRGEVNGLVITRPVVEAGERLGFLPGDQNQKMDPYLKPIYKSLMKLLMAGDIQKGNELLRKLMDAKIIEISPLAFMRGDEFEHKAALLDEGQNATWTQLKMFNTRLAVGGKILITGDPEQTDLVPASKSGFRHLINLFQKAAEPGFTVSRMTEADAVRHPKMSTLLKILSESPPQNYDPYAREPASNSTPSGP